MLLNHKACAGPTLGRESRPPKRILVMLSAFLISTLAACSGAAAVPSSPPTAANPVANSPTAGVAHPEDVAPAATGAGATSARTASGSSASAATPPQAQGMTLKFDGTFPGTQLNTEAWGTCYPWASDGCTNYGNTEDPDLEWYQAPQDQVSGGVLHLIAQRVPTSGLDKQGAAKEYACRSGMVSSFPSLRFTYGYVQVTADIPFGKGLWPAFWLAAANEKWPPEVDILEHWGSEPSGAVYLHPLSGARQGGAVSMPNLSAGWHTFGLSWTKTTLTWYYDGTQVMTTSAGVPQQEMYFIANLADDNTSPGACSGSLLIKSVQVWQ